MGIVDSLSGGGIDSDLGNKVGWTKVDAYTVRQILPLDAAMRGANPRPLIFVHYLNRKGFERK